MAKGRILYYTVSYGVYDDGESLNGNKDVSVYRIEENVPIKEFELSLEISDNSEDCIRAYIQEFDDKKIKLELVML